ncbi:MAG: hypothetical protein ACM3S5_08050 [Rhodospirillales bacterium]
MAGQQPSTIQGAEPTVRRVERGKEAFGANHQTELARLVEASLSMRAEVSERAAGLIRRANEPIQRLLENDPAAKAALVNLRELRLTSLEASLRSRGAQRTFGGSETPSLIPNLHRGVNVFGSPFDLQWTGPNHGDVQASANRLNGATTVFLPGGQGGARWATAGIGLALAAAATGVVHVRPSWQYEYRAQAEGHWLDSRTEGSARVVIQDAVTGEVLNQKGSVESLWNFRNDRSDDQWGYIDSWALGADAFVHAGQNFTVSFLANAMVDDSGSYFFGFSIAAAQLEMRLMYVVAELGPS